MPKHSLLHKQVHCIRNTVTDIFSKLQRFIAIDEMVVIMKHGSLFAQLCAYIFEINTMASVISSFTVVIYSVTKFATAATHALNGCTG